MAFCTHGVFEGQPCTQCPEGRAVKPILKRSLSNSNNNLTPTSIGVPVPVRLAPVEGSPPRAVSSLAIASTSLNATQMLTQIHEYLAVNQNAVFAQSTCANVQAVCWNWVLFGAAADRADDPAWAYEYVQGQQPQAGRVYSPALTLLRNAKRPPFPTSPKIAGLHIAILRALLPTCHLVCDDTSILRVRVWYRYEDYRAVSYTHVEFTFGPIGRIITLTKAPEDAHSSGFVTCYWGASQLFDDTLVCVDVGINPASLSTQHLQVLRQLCNALPGEPNDAQEQREEKDGKDDKKRKVDKK